jgi:hypothetical protein
MCISDRSGARLTKRLRAQELATRFHSDCAPRDAILSAIRSFVPHRRKLRYGVAPSRRRSFLRHDDPATASVCDGKAPQCNLQSHPTFITMKLRSSCCRSRIQLFISAALRAQDPSERTLDDPPQPPQTARSYLFPLDVSEQDCSGVRLQTDEARVRRRGRQAT